VFFELADGADGELRVIAERLVQRRYVQGAGGEVRPGSDGGDGWADKRCPQGLDLHFCSTVPFSRRMIEWFVLGV
jgi:hypothetical protein